MIVSGGDEVRVFAPPKREPQEQIRLEGAGALCVSHGTVFCASDWGDTVWRLDAERLVPTGLFAGGPGMKRILSSPDGTRLLLLCAEADSVLLLDAGCGLPLVLARAGLNPQNIALDETVVLLSHKKADSYIHIDVEFGEGEGKIPVDSIAKRAEAYKPKEKVTYKMIKEYIEAKYGFKVHTAYIAEVKRDLGLPMYDAPNAVEELKQPRKHPTPEKVEAIKDALRYFAVI